MLLSQVIRHAAITGRTDAVGEQILGRQGGRWAHQWIDSAFPEAAAHSHRAAPPADAAATERDIEDLRRRGLLTDAEVARLRASRAG
jgi:hypothetical protein